MGSSLFRRLLKIAKSVVQSVQNTVMQQLDIVRDNVQKQILQYVNQRVSSIWIGQGADAFVNVIQEDVLPRLSRVVEDVTDHSQRINNAVNIMDEADARVCSIVGNLRSKFEEI